MRSITQSLLIIILICTACNRKPAVTSKSHPSLESDSKASSGFYKSRNEPTVGEMYNDLVSADPKLTALEHDLEKLAEDEHSAAKQFNDYMRKNESYYGSALEMIANMKDTSARRFLENKIAQSKANLKNRTAAHDELHQLIQIKSDQIKDLHLSLQLIATLPIMEDYQKRLPSIESTRRHIRQQDSMANRLKQMIE